MQGKKISLPVLQAVAVSARLMYCGTILKNESDEFKKKFLSHGTIISEYTSYPPYKSNSGISTKLGSFFSPKTPMDLLGKDGVKNDHTSEKKPIISEPDHPRRVKCAINRELHPPRR